VFFEGGIYTQSLLTKERIEIADIGIGDDLFLMGLFTMRYGTQRNIPILRSATIAAMPEEPLKDERSGLPYDAFLIEVRSIGGLSGSPVYVMIRGQEAKQYKNTGGGHSGFVGPNGEYIACLLMGMIRGHWDLRTQPGAVDFADEDFANDLDSKLNMGIAIVTPAWEILNVIENNPTLKNGREEDKKRARISIAPTLDSEFQDKLLDESSFSREDFESALRKVSRKIEPEK
jgi:hypothetical protein